MQIKVLTLKISWALTKARARSLPLVNCQQRVGAQLDDVLAQVDALLVLQRLRVPLVQPGGQQHGLPPIDGQADLTLGNLWEDNIKLFKNFESKISKYLIS